jgi:hypothetical protein
MKREDVFCLSKSWKPLIFSLKDCRKPPSQDSLGGFSVGPYQGMSCGLSGHPSALSFCFLPWLSFTTVALFIPHHVHMTHTYDFCPILFSAHHSLATWTHLSRVPRYALAAIFRVHTSYPCLLLVHSGL